MPPPTAPDRVDGQSDEGAAGAERRRPQGPSPVPRRGSRRGNARTALGLVVVVVAAEYLARRVLAPALPTLGAPTVNDMLSVGLAYAVLVAAVAAPGERSTAALARALQAVAAAAASWRPWVGAAAFLGAVIAFAPLDARFWGGITLPAFAAPRSSTLFLADGGATLAATSLLIVNGAVIPLAEERLWRGLIQPRLLAAWGVAAGLIGTALLFSLKHAIVDASLGRLLALTAGGLMLGLVAHRAGSADDPGTGWRAAAVAHLVGNVVATGLALAAGAL